MKDKLSKALNEVRDSFIEEAAGAKKRRPWRMISAVAAVVALFLGILVYPQLPITPNPHRHTEGTGTVDPPAYLTNVISLANVNNHVPTRAPELAQQLRDFFGKSMGATLGQREGVNKAYSPANLYIALSLLAELSGGEEELMALLGADSLEALRLSANQLWNATYIYEEWDVTLLANSIWLDESLTYNPEMMQTLAKNYFTDSFYGDLGSKEVNMRIASWIDHRTGHLLREHTKEIALDISTVFAIYSTLYYDVPWSQQFNEASNIQGVFHGAVDSTVTFMRKTESTYYYRGSNFEAISTGLRTGDMWLILPDQGVSPEEVVASQEYLDLVLGNMRVKDRFDVNLTLPKFDIQTGSSLIDDLKSLGVQKIFEYGDTFSQFIQSPVGQEVGISAINQATRIMAHEMGVTAANYVEIIGDSTGVPPEQVVDFVVDRPFLFVVTNYDHIPLFSGIVNDLS